MRRSLFPSGPATHQQKGRSQQVGVHLVLSDTLFRTGPLLTSGQAATDSVVAHISGEPNQ